ncbi:MAG: hypothetical protein U9N11_05715, partial [Campylobacterota bacterium]|nr:hypothetical protein [Campylobacterota bacterium]
MKRKLSIGFLIVTLITSVVAQEQKVESSALIGTKKSAIVYTIKGNAEAKYNEMIEKDLKPLGFLTPDPRAGVNKVYKQKYGSTTLDALSFMTIVDKKAIKPLLNVDPTIAGFNPFNLLIYKHKNVDETIISHFTPEVVFEMLGTTNQEVKDGYIASMKKLDDVIVKTFPEAKISYETYEKKATDTMMNFELDFERPEDIDDFIDEIQEKIEDSFVEKGYIMAGYFNFKETFDGSKLLPQMDAFWTYSLCHFKYSYTIFDNAGARPEAAVFAPCTMYMYIQKGTNKLVMGMPRLQNWVSLFNITDKKRL